MMCETTLNAPTSGEVLQERLESKLLKKRPHLIGPPEGKTCIFFVNDLNLPVPEPGSVPALEVLRQVLSLPLPLPLPRACKLQSRTDSRWVGLGHLHLEPTVAVRRRSAHEPQNAVGWPTTAVGGRGLALAVQHRWSPRATTAPPLADHRKFGTKTAD